MRRKLFGSRKRKLATLLVIGSLVAAGAGIAAWLITASGPGRTSVGSLVAPTVQVADPTDPALPGDPGSAAFTITNPNGTMYIKTATPDVAAGIAGPEQCTASLIYPPVVTGLSIEVPPGTNVVEIPDVVQIDPNIPDSCQATNYQVPWALDFSTAP